MDTVVPAADANNGEIKPITAKSLHAIYQATLDPLIVLSSRRSDPHVARSASRLQLRGAGLFKMNVPLDTVFESDPEGFQSLRKCILKVFVEILVWEGE